MSKTLIVGAILHLCVQLPLWLFLIYRILSEIGASELTWAAFVVYVPVSFVVAAISAVIKD